MKKATMKNLWMPVLGILMLVASCKKQDIQQESSQEIRATGMLPDDPSKLANLRILVSRDFLTRRAESKGPTKGKPGSGGTTTDQTPPSVAITSPSNGASVSGTVNISVSSSDNVGVTSVSVYINSSLVGTSTSSSPTFSWNTTNLSSGVYTIEATARDAAGNTNSYAIAVTKQAEVIEPTPPPPSPTPSTGFSLAMPAVQNQGSEFSCVAFALGYAARSAEQYYKTGALSYSLGSNVFSPEHLYNVNKISSDCFSGSSILTTLNYMQGNGVVTWNTMPYSYMNGCSSIPTSTQLLEASNYKISSYYGINKADIAGIKAALHQNKPLVIGLDIDASFQNAKTGFIWKSYSGAPVGGHAVVICGYDDSKNAWKIMNSWGTSWGDSGFGWIDYNFLPQAGGGTWTFLMNL